MKQKELISQIFKILLLYEDVLNSNSNVTEKDYLSYLNRIYIFWLGANREDIYNIIKGLQTLGITAEHKTVKSMVFHIIDVLQKRSDTVVF